MRYDAKDGWRGQCFDVRHCCEVRNVAWVNPDTSQWGELVNDLWFYFVNGEVMTRIHQEGSIRVIEQGPKRLFALFNEMDDDGAEDETEIVSVERAQS